MNVYLRVMAFGIISGLIWSVILMAILNVDQRAILQYVCAGVMTGVVLSLLLKPILERTGLMTTVFLGVVSLPLGAFLFGVILGTMDIAATTFAADVPLAVLNLAAR